MPARSPLGLLAGVALLTAGVGLLQSSLGLRGAAEGFGTLALGVLMSGYFAGYLAGSLLTTRLIANVGYIRTFTALGSTGSAVFLAHGLVVGPAAWLALRVLGGFCVAGIVVVAESWLNAATTNGTRGTLLARYMVATFAGLAVGQLMLNVPRPVEIGAFAIVALVVSLSTVPVALTQLPAPSATVTAPMSVRSAIGASPVAFVGALVSGLGNSAILTLAAVYGLQAGLTRGEVSVFVAAFVVAAGAAAMPIGRLSDRRQRSHVLAGTAGLAVVVCVPGLRIDPAAQPLALIVLGGALGALSFAIYPVSLADLNDRVAQGDSMGAGSRLILAYAAGAVAGPVAASATMTVAGPDGFWWYQLVLHVALAGYATVFVSRRLEAADKRRFAPLPSGATSAIVGVTTDDVAEELLTHEITGYGVRLHATETGDGEAVVFAHPLGADQRVWLDQQRSLARAGFRAIAYDLRGHGNSSSASSYRVADHVADLARVVAALDVEHVHLVGEGFGAVLAVDHATRHPDSVRSLTLVSCAGEFPPPNRSARLAWRSARLAEAAASRLLDQRSRAERRAKAHYDPVGHPRRHELLLDADLSTARGAMARTLESTVHFPPPEPLERPPVLVILGERDKAASAPHRRDLQAVLQPATVEQVAGAGAFPQLDDPAGFVELLAPFLEARAPQPA